MNRRGFQIHYAWYERLAMRLLFAAVVEAHILGTLSHITISHPTALARFINLEFLLDPQIFTLARYLLHVAVALYVLRIAWSIALSYMTLFSIAVGTIVNSHGAIAHYMQIVSLVLCAQTAAHFYSWFRPRDREDSLKLIDEDRVIYWSQQAIIATYLVSALTKLIHTNGRWFLQSPMIGVQIIKTTDQDYYDRLDASVYNSGLLVAEWIVQHPLPVGALLSMGLLLEFTTPLALLGRRFALFYGATLIVFHESIDRVMKLQFPFNEYLLWIYLVNVPFWCVFVALWFRGRTKGERLQDVGTAPVA